MNRIWLFVGAVVAMINLPAQTDLFQFSVQNSTRLRQEVAVMAFSPDGQALILGTVGGEVLTVDPSSKGAMPRSISKSGGRITSLAFSRDGSVVVSGSEDGIARIIPVASDGQAIEIRVRQKISSVAISPDKTFVATAAADKGVVVWDANSGRELYRFAHPSKKPFRMVAFTPSGSSLVGVSESGSIVEWDVKTRAIIRQMQEPDPTLFAAAPSSNLNLLSISTELTALTKSALYAGGTSQSTVANQPGPSNGGTQNAPSDPASRLGSIGGIGSGPGSLYREDRIKIYDLEHGGGIVKVLDGINGQAAALTISPDDRFIGLVRNRIKDAFLDVYDVQRGVQITSVPLMGNGTAVAFSPDGRWLGAATDKGDFTIYAVTGVQRGTSPGDLRGAKYQITSKQNEPLIAPTERLKLAVMDLEVNLADRDLGRAVADLLRNRINGTPNIDVIERRQWDQLIKEQSIEQSDRIDPLTAVSLGKGFGVQKMIFGSISQFGTSYTINVRMIDVATLKNDGEREVVCQRCVSEDLPGAVALLKTVLVKE